MAAFVSAAASIAMPRNSQPTPAMTRFSLTLAAKLLAAILIIIVIRALAEVFRLESVRIDPPVAYADVRPFIIGALAAAIALALALVAIQFDRPRSAIVLACLTVIGLFAYRVYFIP
jgi:hypothetical protein